MTISLQSRIEGAVLGAAIGDAMGHPTEFINSFEGIFSKYGPQGITGFELFWTREGKRFAPYTDDTQMAELVLRALVDGRKEDGDLNNAMKLMANGFIAWSRNPQGGHRAPGRACLEGCRALQAGVHWAKAGGATAGGCGSVMRAYPFGIIFHDDPRAAILEGANTPGDSDSIATLAGALTGARCGVESLPAEWVRDVERSEELLGLARSVVEVVGKAG